MRILPLLLSLVCVFCVLPSAADAAGSAFPDVGNRLKPLTLTDMSGKEHRLDWSSVERNTTVILFFQPRCADCFREMVFFDRVGRLAKELDLEIFAIEATGREPKELGEILTRFMSIFQEPAFTVIPDPTYELSTLFDVRRVPSTFLVERHGVVISRKEGFDDLHAIDLVRKMERLLDAKEGTFSPALSSLGVTEKQEAVYEDTLEARKKAIGSSLVYGAPLTVGTKVEAFEFQDVAGGPGEWKPEEGAKKATVVFFWGSLCQPCIREMAYLQELRTAAGPEALEVIAIEGTGLGEKRVKKAIAHYRKFRFPIDYSVGIDPDGKTGRHFGVKGALPQTFLLGSDGEILYHTDEFVQGGELRLAARIEEALGLKEASLMMRIAKKSSADKTPTGEPIPVPEDLAVRSEEFTARLVLAETLYRNWQYSDAIPHYLRCVELDPESVVVKERLAEIYERQGDLKASIAEWEKVLDLAPEHPEGAANIERMKTTLGAAAPR